MWVNLLRSVHWSILRVTSLTCSSPALHRPSPPQKKISLHKEEKKKIWKIYLNIRKAKENNSPRKKTILRKNGHHSFRYDNLWASPWWSPSYSSPLQSLVTGQWTPLSHGDGTQCNLFPDLTHKTKFRIRYYIYRNHFSPASVKINFANSSKLPKWVKILALPTWAKL